jgi:hypothetical protein
MYSGVTMRIGKLFALSMLTVTVFAVILGAEVLVPQTRIYANRSDAIRTVDAFGATLMVSQQVAGLRAPTLDRSSRKRLRRRPRSKLPQRPRRLPTPRSRRQGGPSWCWMTAERWLKTSTVRRDG